MRRWGSKPRTMPKLILPAVLLSCEPQLPSPPNPPPPCIEPAASVAKVDAGKPDAGKIDAGKIDAGKKKPVKTSRNCKACDFTADAFIIATHPETDPKARARMAELLGTMAGQELPFDLLGPTPAHPGTPMAALAEIAKHENTEKPLRNKIVQILENQVWHNKNADLRGDALFSLFIIAVHPNSDKPLREKIAGIMLKAHDSNLEFRKGDRIKSMDGHPTMSVHMEHMVTLASFDPFHRLDPKPENPEELFLSTETRVRIFETISKDFFDMQMLIEASALGQWEKTAPHHRNRIAKLLEGNLERASKYDYMEGIVRGMVEGIRSGNKLTLEEALKYTREMLHQ